MFIVCYKQQRNDERTGEWKEKPLQGQFLGHAKGVTSNISWMWLKKGEFKETEGLLQKPRTRL